MRLQTKIHEDHRRKLVEYIEDFPIRMSKVLFVKEDSTLGNHYHKDKGDIFFLLQGEGTVTLDGHTQNFFAGDCIYVQPMTRHTFFLKRDSILIESSTLPYDKGDEYEI